MKERLTDVLGFAALIAVLLVIVVLLRMIERVFYRGPEMSGLLHSIRKASLRRVQWHCLTRILRRFRKPR